MGIYMCMYKNMFLMVLDAMCLKIFWGHTKQPEYTHVMFAVVVWSSISTGLSAEHNHLVWFAVNPFEYNVAVYLHWQPHLLCLTGKMLISH